MVAAAAIVLTILSGCSQNSVRAVTSSDRGAVNSAVAKLTPPAASDETRTAASPALTGV